MKTSNIFQFNGTGDNFPIYFVNHSNCSKFCSRLTQLLSEQLPEGYIFRIPTEAQWEYAARGGNMSKGYTFSGSNNIDEVAWYGAKYYLTTSQVGKKMKNELGIYDMSGNVWEWCKDWFDEDYYSRTSSFNPTGPIYGFERVLRGGSWRSVAQVCSVSCRFKDFPEVRTNNYGFRLALVKL